MYECKYKLQTIQCRNIFLRLINTTAKLPRSTSRKERTDAKNAKRKNIIATKVEKLLSNVIISLLSDIIN